MSPPNNGMVNTVEPECSQRAVGGVTAAEEVY